MLLLAWQSGFARLEAGPGGCGKRNGGLFLVALCWLRLAAMGKGQDGRAGYSEPQALRRFRTIRNDTKVLSALLR